MLVGAFAELATIGSVMPFLAVISDPERAASYQLIQHMSGIFGWTDPDQIVLPMTVLFGSIMLIVGAIRLLLLWVSQKFVFRVGHDLSAGVYRAALYQPFSYHVATNSSELIAGINKVQRVTMRTLLPLMQVMTGAVVALFLLGALLAINIKIVLLAAGGFAAIYLAISFVAQARLRSNSEIIAEAQTDRVQAVQEGLGGIRDVLLDNAQPVYLKKFTTVDLAFRDARLMNNIIGSSPRYVIETFSIILIAVLALVLSREPGGLIAALPLLGALALGAQRILPAVHNIYNGWAQIKGNQQQLFDVLDLMELPVDPPIDEKSVVIPLAFDSTIALVGISFGYGDEDDLILDDVNFVIKKGSRVGLIGKTGSGKSTIADLVMGLLEPTSGTIEIDGKALNRENILDWQARVAHVAQNIYLTDASLAENIAFAVPRSRIDWELVRRAAEQAAISGFIDNLPQGYDTIVGERGIRLSGGQKQRVGIARAMYKQADVLIFDEATSALDHETEVDIMDAIQMLGLDKTILIVAHRPSTIAICDTVFQVEGGKAKLVNPDGS